MPKMSDSWITHYERYVFVYRLLSSVSPGGYATPTLALPRRGGGKALKIL
jgi:hypothetical protein